MINKPRKGLGFAVTHKPLLDAQTQEYKQAAIYF